MNKQLGIELEMHIINQNDLTATGQKKSIEKVEIDDVRGSTEKFKKEFEEKDVVVYLGLPDGMKIFRIGGDWCNITLKNGTKPFSKFTSKIKDYHNEILNADNRDKKIQELFL